MRQSSSNSEKEYELPQCTICTHSLASNLSLLDCGHVFHQECISSWIKHKTTCPICRDNVGKKKIQKIIFQAEEKGHNKKSNKSQFKSLQKEKKGIQKQRDQLLQKIKQKQKKIVKLEKELQQMKDKKASEIKKLNHQIQNLDKLMQDLLKQAQKSEKTIKQLNSSLINYERTNLKSINMPEGILQLLRQEKDLLRKNYSQKQIKEHYLQMLKVKYLTEDKLKSRIKDLVIQNNQKQELNYNLKEQIRKLRGSSREPSTNDSRIKKFYQQNKWRQ